MSLINTQVQPFKVNAFHNGKFIEVTEESLKGKWSVLIFMPAAFTFNCPTEIEDAANNYGEFQKAGAEVYIVTTDTHFAQGLARNLPGRRQGPVPADRRPDPPADQRLRRAHPGRRPGPARYLRDQPGRRDQDRRDPLQRDRP